MSYSIDANVLLYASDETNALCTASKAFLAECSARTEPLCLCWPVVMAYLRTATHPRIFTEPLSPSTAAANVEALLALPQARPITEGNRFWQIYREISGQVVVRANLVPDAHIAALLLEHDVGTIYTRDADFRKFPGIRVRDPF